MVWARGYGWAGGELCGHKAVGEAGNNTREGVCGGLCNMGGVTKTSLGEGWTGRVTPNGEQERAVIFGGWTGGQQVDAVERWVVVVGTLGSHRGLWGDGGGRGMGGWNEALEGPTHRNMIMTNTT